MVERIQEQKGTERDAAMDKGPVAVTTVPVPVPACVSAMPAPVPGAAAVAATLEIAPTGAVTGGF